MAFCKNCGESMDPNAAVCMKCGFASGQGQNHCPNCGMATVVGAAFCTGCGFGLQGAQQNGNANVATAPVQQSNAFCKNCGQSMDPNAAVCMSCGFAAGTGTKHCRNCGKGIVEGAAICTNCGFAIQEGKNGKGGINKVPGQAVKSKMTAGLLGIFLGWTGAMHFYLQNKKMAFIHLGVAIGGIVLLCVAVGAFILLGNWIWGLVEGIMVLTGHTKTDGNGNPLIQ